MRRGGVRASGIRAIVAAAPWLFGCWGWATLSDTHSPFDAGDATIDAQDASVDEGDASYDARDSSLDQRDTSIDVGSDIVDSPADRGIDRMEIATDVPTDSQDSATCTPPPPPRAIAPLSTSIVNSSVVTLTWLPASSASTLATVEICPSLPGCAQPQRIAVSTGSTTTVTLNTPGVYFWRLRGGTGACVSTAASNWWEFRVRTSTTSTDPWPVWGSILDIDGRGHPRVAIADPQANSQLGAVHLYALDTTDTTPPMQTVSNQSYTSGSMPDFAGSIASAGDVNGDGRADLIVGAPGSGLDAGAAFIFVTNLSTMPSALFSANPVALTGEGFTQGGTYLNACPCGEFGLSVAYAGDINRDGYADVVVGAPGEPRASPGDGVVYVFYGSATGAPSGMTTITGTHGTLGGLGSAVTGGVDFDGCGVPDVIAGAPGENKIYVFSGMTLAGHPNLPMSTSNASMSFAAGSIGGTTVTGEFGAALDVAGDFDGDGHPDVVVGASQVNWRVGTTSETQSGAAEVISSRTSHRCFLATGTARTQFGSTVAGGVDVNGDGMDDVLIGNTPLSGAAGTAHLALGGTNPSACITTAGSTSSGFVTMTTSNSGVTSCPATVGNYAVAVAAPGDTDGDGVGDIGVGWPLCSTVAVYFGYTQGTTDAGMWSLGASRLFNSANADFGQALALLAP